MKIIARKLTLAWLSSIVFCLMFVGASYAKVPAEAVEGAWLLDEGAGNVARDASGNGRDGEILGEPGWVNGEFGKALEFDGVDDGITINGYFGVGGIEPRTVCLWFKANETRDHSWVKWGINLTGEKYYVRAHPDGDACYLRVEVNGGQCYGVTDVCDGAWHHLAVVFPDGSDSVKDHLLYVDGALEGEHLGNDCDMNTSNAEQDVHLGDPLENHTHANGLMDEIAVFNVALGEDDIKSIMNNGLLEATAAVEYAGKLVATWAAIKLEY